MALVCEASKALHVARETIAVSRVTHDCATTEWFRYAMHRSELPDDGTALAALQQRFWDSGGFVPDLL